MYWISLITLIVLFAVIVFVLWKKRIKENVMNIWVFRALFVFACVVLFFINLIASDIPSVLDGGDVIYTDELPKYMEFGMIRYFKTDNEELKHLKFCNRNLYEEHGNYRIRYTKHTKFVLSVEKLD